MFLAAVLLAAAVSPSPVPSPAPSADPCGGATRLLATLNRPTVGYSACAVAARTAVLEEGYQSEQLGAGGTLVQYPQSFIRFGAAPRVELDLIGPAYNSLGSVHGYSDNGVGFKYEFAPKGPFTYAVDGLYTTPNGSQTFTNGGYAATVNLDVSYSITPSFGIGTTQALSALSGQNQTGEFARYGAWMPSFVATEQFGRTSQFYEEYVYASKLAPDRGARAFIDYGVQHLLGEHVEIDAELGHALTGAPALRFDYFGIGAGLEIAL